MFTSIFILNQDLVVFQWYGLT